MSARKLFELGFDRNQQETDQVKLTPEGTFPEWLAGSFIRNGPGLFHIGTKRFNHWFDGLGMLHKFDFRHGTIRYQNKFLECHATKEAFTNDKLTYSEFATDPCWSIFGRLRSIFKHGPTDSAKVNLAKVGNQYFALGETTMQLEFDVETLQTLSRYNFHQPKFGTSSTAHPHFDEHGAINLITKYGPVNRYQITRMDQKAQILASVRTFSPAYMHSFGMTDKYYIIAESPFTVQSLNLMVINRPFIENFRWKKNRGTRVWVIEKSTGKVIFKKEIDPFFFFHFVNSFDTEKGLSFDIVTYPDAAIIDSYYLANIEKGNRPIPGGTLNRFEINLTSKEVIKIPLSKAAIELPHFDHQRYDKRRDYRFVYAMGKRSSNSIFYDALIKIDIQKKHDQIWHLEGCYPGEPILYPHRKVNRRMMAYCFPW